MSTYRRNPPDEERVKSKLELEMKKQGWMLRGNDFLKESMSNEDLRQKHLDDPSSYEDVIVLRPAYDEKGNTETDPNVRAVYVRWRR